MSKRADKEWGEMWSNEKEMECKVALQTFNYNESIITIES